MEVPKGNSSDVNKILRYVSNEDKLNMDYFYLEGLTRIYESDNKDALITEELSYDDNNVLLEYSGYNFKHINAVLRDTWNYEENGHISNSVEYLRLARRLEQIIREHPTKLQTNIMTYRGVDLNYFKQYGITNLEDLRTLEGQYMLDRGFVSTSICEDSCFFKKENDINKNYNIKIEYMIPEEFQDGIYLGEDSSYSPNQQEFLINSYNLSRVSRVIFNGDNTAVLRAMIIPKELYDEYYRSQSNKISK